MAMGKHYLPKNGKESRATSERGYLYSQIFKPITTARHQVMMKGIACPIETRISINMVGRTEVMIIKTMETGRGVLLWLLAIKRYINTT